MRIYAYVRLTFAYLSLGSTDAVLIDRVSLCARTGSGDVTVEAELTCSDRTCLAPLDVAIAEKVICSLEVDDVVVIEPLDELGVIGDGQRGGRRGIFQ